MFITFEGIDGSGKTTQLNLLKEKLAANGIDVVNLREPGGSVFSEKIREVLLHSKEEINAVSELLMFESARAHLVETVIKPALNEGKYVLCDRFYDSTTAYQGYGRGLSIDLINFLNNLVTNGLKPDLTFYMRVSMDTAIRRAEHRVLDRIELEGSEFMIKVDEGFKQIAENEKNRIVVINADTDIQTTHNIIMQHISERVSKF